MSRVWPTGSAERSTEHAPADPPHPLSTPSDPPVPTALGTLT
jgi:hypothetical protein